MEESESQPGGQPDWKDLITRRLITKVEDGESGAGKVVDKKEGMSSKRGEVNLPQPNENVSSLGTEKIEVTDGASATPDPTLLPTTFTKIEKSLASLGFFTPSSRRIKEQKVKRIGFTRELDGKRVEVTGEILPSALYGLPITADQDKYLALQEIITKLLQSDGEVKNPVRFRSADLLRLLGRNTKTGKNYKEISEWLVVMSSTTIQSNGVVYIHGKKRYATDLFHVFDRVVSVGKELEDGTVADANYVWLSSWQLENINNNWLLPIDFVTYRGLKNHIAKALVPLLQIWLFASQKAGSFEKRYDELCEILTLQQYSSPSQILRQLTPSLDELKQCGYLEKWRIEKTTDRKAYKIILFHGSKFHRDRRRRIEQKNQNEMTVVIGESEPLDPELLQHGRLVEHTYSEAPNSTSQKSEKIPVTVNNGKSENQQGTETTDEISPILVDELSTRGLMPSVAIKLLQSVPANRITEVPDYIDYWDQAKNVEPGFLYDLIKTGGPLPSSFETRREREKKIAAQVHRQKLQAIKQELATAFEHYRDMATDRFIAEELTSAEFERRVAARLRTSPPQEGLWNRPEVLEQTARRAERRRIEEEMGTHRFLPYEEFCKRELPTILTSLGLTPAEFPELSQRTTPPSPPVDSTSVSA